MSTKKSSGSATVGGDVMPVKDGLAAEVNKPLAERPLATSFCWACDACGRILAIQHPGEPVKTRGGQTLDGPPKECTGPEGATTPEEGKHGPWVPAKHDYHRVVINQKDEIVRGKPVE